jgi:hypothetical protein
MADRLLTKAEKDTMEKLSLGILDLCEKSGLNDGHLIVNAAIFGLAGVIGATIPENATEETIQEIGKRAGEVLAGEIVSGQKRFLSDLAAYSKPKH